MVGTEAETKREQASYGKRERKRRKEIEVSCFLSLLITSKCQASWKKNRRLKFEEPEPSKKTTRNNHRIPSRCRNCFCRSLSSKRASTMINDTSFFLLVSFFFFGLAVNPNPRPDPDQTRDRKSAQLAKLVGWLYKSFKNQNSLWLMRMCRRRRSRRFEFGLVRLESWLQVRLRIGELGPECKLIQYLPNENADADDVLLQLN